MRSQQLIVLTFVSVFVIFGGVGSVGVWRIIDTDDAISLKEFCGKFVLGTDMSPLTKQSSVNKR